MKDEVATNTIDKLVRETEGRICLEFHGGEPLLHYPFISKVVDYASQFTLSEGVPKFHFSIQTNATLIDEEKAKFLKEKKFRVGISCDGPKERNDKTRIKANGKGSYEEIMKGVRNLQSQNINFGTIMVIRDPEDVDGVYDFMNQTGIKRIKLNNYFRQGRGVDQGGLVDNMVEYAHRTLSLIDTLAEHNLQGGEQLKLANASIMLRNILTQERSYMCMRFPCGAGDAMIGIDINGDTYPCEEMTGKKGLVTGNILSDDLSSIFEHPINRELRTRDQAAYQDCNKCSLISVCEVSCANRSYNESGGFTSKSEKCAYYKVMFPELILRAVDNPEGMNTLI